MSQSLKDEILAGGFDLQNRDDGLIAASLSVGRKKLVTTEIGNGSILATIGIESGNNLLDAIHSQPQFRYVTPLIDQGRLDVASMLTRGSLDNLADVGVITQAEADAVKALAEVDDPVSAQAVAKALEGM